MALLLTMWLTVAPPPTDETSIDTLRAAVSQWQASVAFTATYELRYGLAQSLDEALRGEFDDGLGKEHPGSALTVTGTFNKLGPEVRYSLDYGRPPIELKDFVKPGSKQKAWKHVTFDDVTNGELQVSYNPLQGTIVGTAVIAARPARFVGTLSPGARSNGQISPLSPLGMGEGHPFALLQVGRGPQDSNTAQREVRLLPDNRLEVSLRDTHEVVNQERRVILSLDEELPVVESIVDRLEFPDGSSRERHAVLSDFQQCEGGPVARRVLTATVSHRADGSPMPVGLQVWTSEDLGLKPPTHEDFVITVPSTTTITGLKQRPPKGTPRRIDLAALSIADLVPRAAPQPPPESNATRLRWVVVLNAVVVVVLFLLVLHRRTRRHLQNRHAT